MGLGLGLGMTDIPVGQGPITESAPSGVFSSLTADAFLQDADGTPNGLEGLLLDVSGNAVAGATVTLEVEGFRTIDVAASTAVIVGSDEIPDDDTTPGTILVTLVSEETGDPLVGVPVTGASSRPATDAVTGAVTDRSGQCLVTIVSDTPGTSVVTLSAAGVALDDEPEFTVTGPTPPVTISFFSEWEDGGTGSTTTALTDDGKWDSVGGTPGTGATIVAPTGLGLATRGNLFRAFNSGTTSCVVVKEEMVPAQTTHWGSVYFKDPRTDGNHQHPICIGGIGGVPIQVNLLGLAASLTGTTYTAKTLFTTAGSTPPYPHEVWRPGTQGVAGVNKLLSDTWYLLEWNIEYLTATRIRLSIWLSLVDGNGDVTTPDVYTAATIMRSDYAGEADGNLAVIGAAEPTYFGMAPDPEDGRKYVLGNEGPSGGVNDGQSFYMASLAISLDGRIGDMVRA